MVPQLGKDPRSLGGLRGFSCHLPGCGVPAAESSARAHSGLPFRRADRPAFNGALMCSVLLLHRALSNTPLAVFFVRDEELGRAGDPPELREDWPGILAPRDPRAGGTWLGVNAGGLLAGLVNRRGDPLPDGARSRGQLLLGLLQAESVEAALEGARRRLDQEVFGGCRVFLGDGRRLCLLDLPAGEPLGEVRELGPGAWLLRHTRHAEAAPEMFQPAEGEAFAAWSARARRRAAAHLPEEDPLCKHGESHGSVDTTLLALDSAGRPAAFLHGEGSPCQAEMRDYGGLLQSLRATPS